MISDRPEAGAATGLIRAEIRARGPISFARFMELALYAPEVGYYQQPDRPIGRGGDFYTSVSVGPVFGFLLAQRFVSWCRGRASVRWVEAAAHDGQLADDVLHALGTFHPDFLPRVRYTILEPFAAREAAQRRRLQAWGDRVSWVRGWAELEESIDGVIFANELLDAMPVHRWGWDAARRSWFEWGVTEAAAGSAAFAWCRLGDPSELPDFALPADLAAVIPDGFILESSPAAVAWWQAAARRVAAGTGWLATFDYGYDAVTPLRPERPDGSLRAYYRHRMSGDLLAGPGDQDLTAHVDFRRITEAGEGEGLETVAAMPQGRWLGAVAAEILGAGGPAGAWLAARARGLQTLLHPAHLGQAFEALVQRRRATK